MISQQQDCPGYSANGKRASIKNNIDRTNTLLQTAANCASALLSNEDFERGVNEALKILGTNINADRLGIGEQHNDPTGKTLGYVIVTPYEWLSLGTVSQVQHPELSHINCEDFKEGHHKLINGQHWGGSIEAYPEPFRSGQVKLGVKATYAIPVMVKGQYWGFLGLDFCRTARELCDAEIAVLKTTATCIGSAIQRERNRQAKERAERTALLEQQKAEELLERDRLQRITAQAARALLNDENLDSAIAQALKIIGQGIDTDRVAVMEHHDDSTGNSLGFIRILYEWHSTNAVSQLLHPSLQQIGYEGMEDWYESFQRGEAVGGIVTELSEPVRSGQQELGVKSLYAVPIAIAGQYWGVVGFDDCKEAKQRSETEISILKTIAACIGSAIQQSRIRREREHAERTALLEQQKATQLAKHNWVLEKRDRILSATAEASNILLARDNFDEAVNKALQIIGECIDTDRVQVIENWHDSLNPSIPHWRVLYEWNSAYAVSQIEDPEVSQGSYEGIEEWYKLQSRGYTLRYKLEEMPEPFKSIQAKAGVKVLHAVPIFVEGNHWGVVGFDDCRKVTHHTDAELSILKTAAACIGSAIQQERIRREKEAVERNILLEREKAAMEKAAQLSENNRVLSLRDRWLEATANAAKKLLKISDLNLGINAALKVLGESLDCDRIGIMQYFAEGADERESFVCQRYEWNSVGTISQIDHPELYKISSLGMEKYFARISRGEYVGGFIDEYPEPFRSGQIELGVKSTYSVPIFVSDRFWGIVGIDHCREAKLLTLPEISVFKTVASCISSVIYRQQIQQAKEEAERNILLEREKAAMDKAAQLAESNRVLSLRDRWLEATANAANKLLEITDLNKGIDAALKMLGESLDCDRLQVWQLVYTDRKNKPELGRILYEWNLPNVSSQILHPDLNEMLVEELGAEWIEKLLNGDWVGGAIDELTESFRNSEIELDAKSTYIVPFFLNGVWWGTVSMDFCREPRLLTLPEIAVFKTAASCVGSAIYRQQIQAEKEESERQRVVQLEESNSVLSLRDRWLEATANAANKLLQNADLDAGINAALKMLGESLDCDRVDIMQHIEDDTGEYPGFVRMLYEWHSSYAIPQISHPQSFQATWHEDWLKAAKTGEFTGGTIDELDEPCKSEQLEVGVKSLYNAPIFVNNQFWGILGIDFCREARRLTLPEIAVFKTAASCVGSAIYRQQIQQEKERAELAILDERNRMAREIHDTLAQAFTGISLQLEAAKNNLLAQPEAARERLLQAKNLAKEGINEARRSVRSLRPEALESGDLVTALQQLMTKMVLGTNIKSEVSIEGEPFTLNSAVEVELFRIAQEALTNTLRYARASEIWIQLIFETDTVYLSIEDNGIGFDLQSHSTEGFGLIGIRERCDRLNCDLIIDSAIAKGTKIVVTVSVS